MAEKVKDFLVSTADVAFFFDDMLAFTGTTSLNTSISVSMEDQEITGGKGNKTLYKFKYGRKVSATIEAAEWSLAYLAANVGSNIFTGLRDVFAINECVTLVKGVGTLEKVPIGKVHVEKNDGSIIEVTPTGSTITIGEEDDNVRATYQYNTQVKYITIDADSTPFVGRLVMTADKHNSKKGKVGQVQIEIPSFQLSGSFDISMEASGATTTQMNGDALAVEGQRCSDGSVYGYITEITDDAADVAVIDIASSPSQFSLKVNGKRQLSVVGIRGGLYSNIGIEAEEATFVSDKTNIATVESDGTVTAVAEGTAQITVTYKKLTDTVDVTVTA